MKGTMKRIGSMVLVFVLVTLPLGTMALADGLLQAMLGISLREGRTIEGTLSIDGGDILASFSPIDGNEGAAELALITNLLNNGLIRARYSKVDEQDVVGLAFQFSGDDLITLDVRPQGDGIALETSLLPGRTFVADMQISPETILEQMPVTLDDDMVVALSDAPDRYGPVFEKWAAEFPVTITVHEVPVPATETRNAVSTTIDTRVTAEQLSSLLRGLAEAFAGDTALQTAIAQQMGGMDPASLAAMAQILAGSPIVPTGSALAIAISLDQDGELAGIDVNTALVSTSPDEPAPQGRFTFSLKSSGEGNEYLLFEIESSWDGHSSFNARLMGGNTTPLPMYSEVPKRYSLVAVYDTPDTGALKVQAMAVTYKNVEPIGESFSYNFDVYLSAAEGPDDLKTGMPMAPLFEAGFSLKSQTDVVVPDDFVSMGSLLLRLMRQTMTVQTSLKSTTFVPTIPTGNTIVKINELSESELDALTQELQANVAAVLRGALLGDAVPQDDPAPQGEDLQTPADARSYVVDGESVTAIDAVIGVRAILRTDSDTMGRKPFSQVYYATDTLLDDLQSYLNFLIDNGWALARIEGDMENGTLQLATESNVGGHLLLITIQYMADQYSVRLDRAPATLRRYTDGDGNKLGEITYSNE